jgi:hypothetical protein
MAVAVWVKAHDHDDPQAFVAAQTNLRQIGVALHEYAADWDGKTPPHYGYGTADSSGLYHNPNNWVGKVAPYVVGREVFFDPLLGLPEEDDTLADGTPVFNDPYSRGETSKMRWTWVTSFGINSDGFSQTGSGECTQSVQPFNSVRPLAAITEPSQRLAVAPTRFGVMPYGWMRFQSQFASWPYIDEIAVGWSPHNTIWDARTEYPGDFYGLMAEGSVQPFGREKFIAYSDDPDVAEATNIEEYCETLLERDLDEFWGRYWTGD